MLNILFTIIFSSILYVVFKIFKILNINIFQAIVCNYFFASFLGLYFSETPFQFSEISYKSWFPFAIIIGVLFVTVFNVMAKTILVTNLTVASVASKMSMVIPALFGILILKEPTSLFLWIGLFLAIISVYFVSKKPNESFTISHFGFPILLFLGSGTVDTLINVTQHSYLNKSETALFSGFAFLFAFLSGFSVLLFLFFIKKQHFALKNLIAGLFLGIPNYFSLYFTTRSLQIDTLSSATIFTILNIGVILLTTLIGLLFFKEKLYKLNYIGILLALIALFLVTQ
ncbi:EamA family transporter [Flavobacterium sp.]|uniref:EamA family transporter n=1 Tax=Flavobacterium sp. TaxID=239 RepID=UPI00352938AD